MTGKLIPITACHSFQSSGKIANNPCKNGMYKIAKWSDMDNAIA